MKNRRGLLPKAFFIGAFTSVLTLNAQNVPADAVGVTQGVHTVHTELKAAASVEQFWTAERLKAARPFEATLRAGSDGKPMASETAAAFNAPKVKSAGGLPSVHVGTSLQKTLIPASSEDEVSANQLNEATDQVSGVVPEASSPFGAVFTTSRVFPDAATLYYPYRTAGKLFFHDPVYGGYYYCSASVLRP